MTVIFTESVLLSAPLLTVRSKVRSVFVETFGVINVGFATLALDNVTMGPAFWTHENVTGVPSGSELPEPLRVTGASSFAVWSGPALATGILL